MYVVKTKALIAARITAQLICIFVFAHENAGFLIPQLIFAYVKTKVQISCAVTAADQHLCFR